MQPQYFIFHQKKCNLNILYSPAIKIFTLNIYIPPNKIQKKILHKQKMQSNVQNKNEICEAILPIWWFDCKGNYLCTNCDMLFGKEFNISDNEYDMVHTMASLFPLIHGNQLSDQTGDIESQD